MSAAFETGPSAAHDRRSGAVPARLSAADAYSRLHAAMTRRRSATDAGGALAAGAA
jgi:hypothetical protein